MSTRIVCLAALAALLFSAPLLADDGSLHLTFFLRVSEGGKTSSDIVASGVLTRPNAEFSVSGGVSRMSGDTIAQEALIEAKGQRMGSAERAEIKATGRYVVYFGEGPTAAELSGTFTTQATILPGEEVRIASFTLTPPNAKKPVKASVFVRAEEPETGAARR